MVRARLPFIGVALALMLMAQGAFGRTEPAADVPATLPAGPAEALVQARTLRDEGRSAEAETLLRQALANHPDDPALARTLADTLVDLEKLPEAVEVLEGVIARWPDDVDSRFRLADFYLWTQRDALALEQYLVLLQFRAHDPALRRKTADVLMAMDRAVEAIPHLEAYLSAIPGDLEALQLLHNVYLWNDRFDDALSVLRRMAELMPDDLEIRRLLAQRVLEQGDEKEAIVLYQGIIAAAPADTASQRRLGLLYEWNNAPEKALKQYEIVLAQEPDDTDIRARAASLSAGLGKTRKARAHARKLDLNHPVSLQIARDALMLNEPAASMVGVDYLFYMNNQDFMRHQVGVRGSAGINDDVYLGGFYRYHWMEGPGAPSVPGGARGPEGTIMAHEVGVFTGFRLPSRFSGRAGVSLAWHDTNWVSVNGFADLTGVFGPVAVTVFFDRADTRTTLGAVQREIVSNNAGLRLWAELHPRVFFWASGEYRRVSDGNNGAAGEAALGYLVLRNPRIELAYTYNIQAYSNQINNQLYFSPSRYQTHGPMAVVRHPLGRYFAYGLDLRFWHAIEDETLSLTYGARLIGRPGGNHLLVATFQRTDTVWGFSSQFYNETIVTAAYSFEF